MKLTVAMPPGPRTLEHAQLASELGYERIWLYDSASVYEDVWIWLARIAEHTTIDFGAAVLVPNLRHVMTTASAIATIERLAPGRMAIAIGTGASARWVLGQKSLSWQATRGYVAQLHGLLQGQVVEIDGKRCQMIHHPDWALARPIKIPLLLSAIGPKGGEIARQLHAAGIVDGIMAGGTDSQIPWRVVMIGGTVLEAGETLADERVKQAVGPWYVVSFHHAAMFRPEILAEWPGGAEWRANIEAERPEGERHLAANEGHITNVTPRDRVLVDAAGDALAANGLAWVGTRAEIRAMVEATAASGATELMYAPAGPDLPREMRLFAEAVLH